MLLGRSGFQLSEQPEEAEVLIVNTCGFIGPAREESLAVLRELAQGKREDQLLIAAGCLTQRYGSTVVDQVPGINGVLGTRRWMDIVSVVKSLRERRHPEPLYHLPETPVVGKEERGVDRVAVSGASAYLKIADGCRRPCAFCAIPLIKGPAVSRPAEAILGDARRLQEAGVREVILIAQDTTDYGHDLGVKDGLVELLKDLVTAIPDVDWIRVMYAYPGYVTDRLIEVMAGNDQILPYLDMPLQHADPNILRAMRRPANVEWVRMTIAKMRGAMPGLALRTTFIVGYPGETEQDFVRLLDFIQEIQFDRVGVFSYSPESGTAGESLGDPIPLAVKEERLDRLMTLQQRISLERNQTFLGKSLPVLIEGCGDGISLGRSYRDAPEIDGMVIVEEEVRAGEMIQVRITGALEYDLSGVIADGAAAPL